MSFGHASMALRPRRPQKRALRQRFQGGDRVEGGLLTGRVAVVTGGAGGIGGAVCDLFAGEGADVVVGDIDLERTRQVVERVRAKGRRAVPVVADLTKKAGI